MDLFNQKSLFSLSMVVWSDIFSLFRGITQNLNYAMLYLTEIIEWINKLHN